MIGICTRYNRHEATYAALRLADWYESRGEEVSLFTMSETPTPVSDKWDRRVIVDEFFSQWSPTCSTVLWTSLPHPEQVLWVKQCNSKAVALVLWHTLTREDRTALALFDRLLCPRAACHSFLRSWGIKNSVNVGWDCGYPIFRKPDDYQIEGLKVLLPLWDGNARRTEMTILDVVDRCLTRDDTCKFTIPYSSSSLNSAARRTLKQLAKKHENRVALVPSVHPDTRPLLYSSHDLTLWPSHYENTCMTAHASYEMGTPVLGFSYTPTNECLDDQIAIPVPCRGTERNDLGLPSVIPNYQMMDEMLLHAVQDVEYVRHLQQNIAQFTDEPRQQFDARLAQALLPKERNEA